MVEHTVYSVENCMTALLTTEYTVTVYCQEAKGLLSVTGIK